MVIGICSNCKKERSIHLRKPNFSGEDKIYCNYCYRKLFWKRRNVICPRCKKNRPHHARGLCNGCYNSIFHIEKVRADNIRKSHNISPELYNKITESCAVCGFRKIVEIHHVDLNHNNNSTDNLAGLCPNHHKMVHHRDHRKEVFNVLEEKGFKVPEIYKEDEHYKNLKKPTIPKVKKQRVKEIKNKNRKLGATKIEYIDFRDIKRAVESNYSQLK